MSKIQVQFTYATTNHPSGKILEGTVVANTSQTIGDLQKAVAIDIAKQHPSAIDYQVLLFNLRGFPLSGAKSANNTTLDKAGFTTSAKIYVKALLHVPGFFFSKFCCLGFIRVCVNPICHSVTYQMINRTRTVYRDSSAAGRGA